MRLVACQDCGVKKNLYGHNRCHPCRKAIIRDKIAAGEPVNDKCIHCSAALSLSMIARCQKKCDVCSGKRKLRENKDPLVRSWQPLSPKLCQICGTNSKSYNAPDETGVPCCYDCYMATKKLMKLIAANKIKRR